MAHVKVFRLRWLARLVTSTRRKDPGVRRDGISILALLGDGIRVNKPPLRAEDERCELEIITNPIADFLEAKQELESRTWQQRLWYPIMETVVVAKAPGASAILTKVSDAIDLPTILGTVEGIAALGTFLHKSGAFTKTGEKRSKGTKVRWEDEPEPAEPANDDLNGDPDDEDGDGGGART
ncbi:hypothetical protein B0H21DRAFT_843753 [Amylocystis lapponica]|nr:hypothetical protein B0H21DRAFT_843753 [Amylocystis lapponica]